MFEKTTDNRTHADVIREPGNAGPQRAHSAHDKIDLDAGHRCFVQCGNDLGLEQRIHFGDDCGFLPRLGLIRFLPDRRQDLRMQRERRLPQVLELARLAQPRELHEYLVHVCADLLIAAEQAEVRIQHGGARVIVAGAQMHVTAQPIVLAAQYH